MPRLIFSWENRHRSGRSTRCRASRGVLALLLVQLAAAADAKQVLVLYSNSRLLPANVVIDSGLRQTINSTPGQPVRIFPELLDEPEFGGDRYELTMSTYLRDKYADRPPDAVLIAGDTALRFIMRYRDRLFPAVPVVYAAVTREMLQSIPTLPSDIVGVPVAFDFAGTVEQALKWHPRATHLPGFDVQVSFQYPWFTPPASIPETQAANDASFAVPAQYGDARRTARARDASQLRAQTLAEFSVDDFDGLAAWRNFCAAGSSGGPVSVWMRSVGRLRRMFPITFASLLGIDRKTSRYVKS
jgi:hypothetical protein